MPEPTVLFGTQLYPATGDAARRQARAVAALIQVAPLPPINLQFSDRREFLDAEGCETRAILEQDSNRVTGRRGPRKPIVSEVFTRLAELAFDRGIRYFGFSNADILLTPAAIERIRRGDRPAFAIARTDVGVDGTLGCEPLLYGTDVFAIDASWWLAHQREFRPYILGEACWDNVYAAQLLCLAGGLLLNREPLVQHEAHAIAWQNSPFAEHNGYLAALDRMYFTRWAMYAARLETIRREARGLGSLDDELRLQEQIFRNWKPGVADHVIHALRVAKLRAGRRLRRRP
jgi:hypothetical protein